MITISIYSLIHIFYKLGTYVSLIDFKVIFTKLFKVAVSPAIFAITKQNQ